jgi:hypothetical protein
VHVDLDTLATALYVKIDDELEGVSAAQPVATEGRDRSEDHRCRTHHGIGDAGPAGLPRRKPLDPLRP